MKQTTLTKQLEKTPKRSLIMEKQPELIQRSRLWVTSLGIAMAIAAAPFQASETVYETVDYTKATHQEMVEDMRVKVLGGHIPVNRFYRVVRQRAFDPNGNVIYVGVSGATGTYRGNTLMAGAVASGSGGSTGSTTVAPDYNQGVWQFNRKWHDLIFLDRDLDVLPTAGAASSNGNDNNGTTIGTDTYEPVQQLDESGARYIDRNDFVYVKKSGTNYYEYQHNGSDLRITITDTGYRWSNRKGDWIDYDENGKAAASGDKNNVRISIVRDANGYIHQFTDHFDRVVLTYTYAGNKPVKVEDYTGRQVLYTWDGDSLTGVTTTRGHQWSYEYSLIGNKHTVLTSKTDPEGQTFGYTYGMSGGGYQNVTRSAGISIDIIGGSNTNSAGFDGSDGGSSSSSVAVPSMLMHSEKVYPDGKRVRYQYYYDQESSTYTLIETDSDGFERERWFDLDGQVQRHYKGGLLADKRIRNGRIAVSTDPYGNKTTTQYDRWEAITSRTYADGSSMQYEYLANYNFPTLEVDELGVKTKHEYDGNGNRTRTIAGFESSDERITEYVYDQYGQVTTERKIGRGDTPTVITSYEYDDYGNLTKRTDARGNVTDYKNYNALGLYGEMVDGRRNSWLYEYDAHGNKTRETTPLGFITQYEYDKLHRLTKTIDAELRETAFQYDSRNKLIRETNNLGDAKINTYRVDGKILNSKDESGQLTSYRYDRSARLIETTDGVGNKTSIDYERGNELAGGRIQKVTTPNNTVYFAYDKRSRQTLQRIASDDGLENRTETAYSYRGERIRVIDGNGYATAYVYNEHRELISETNAEDETIQYSFDVRGNLVAVTDAENRTTQYEYDANNNKTAEIRPMGERQVYAYDANNNLQSKTDYNGNLAAYQYDNDNRVNVLTNTKAGEANVERTVSYTYDKTNRQLSFNDGATNTVYQLDGLGRNSQQSTTFIAPGFTKALATSYYANSQIKSRTDAEGNPTLYTYDAAGKLQTVQIANGGTVAIDSYNGNLPTSVSYPGGTNRMLEYDSLARLKRILVTDNADNTLMDYHYGFDPVGNIVSKTTGQGQFDYQYDKVYRLTNAEQPNGFGNQGYAYDNNGNRLTRDNDEIAISYQYNVNHGLNQIVEDSITELLSYDDNGAITDQTGGTDTLGYTYNSFARIETVLQGTAPNQSMVASYQYDASSRRISKTVNGEVTYFLYDESGLSGEYDANGNLIRAYIYKTDGLFTTDPVAQKIPSQSGPQGYEYVYYQNDHLATPQQLINAGGQVVWQGEYDVFGSVAETIITVTNPLRLPGQYQDPETGLYYNWHRYYQPKWGRYVTSDPIGLGGGMNTYTYVGGNPLRQIDPVGLVDNRTIFTGGELIVGIGFGFSEVTCCDGNNNRKRMLFKKSCLGPSINVGLSVGIVSGLDGPRCDPQYYVGWFGEINFGPASIDIGLSGGETTPSPEPTGVNEGGLGVGLGGGAALCWYEFVEEEIIGKCGGCE